MNNKVKDILNNTLVVDGLFHAILKDPPPECGNGKDIVDMILDGGVNCLVDSIIADNFSCTFNDLLNEIYSHNVLVDVIPEKFKIVESVDDIYKAKEEGKLAFVMSTQGSDFLESDLRKISLAYKLGLRILQVTYNNECSFGCGAYVKNDTGLTRFGQQAIIEMNRVGMLIDISHVGEVTAMETIEASSEPVIYSHAGVRAISKHVRNATDEHIKALAKKNGVLGICPHGVMTTNDLTKRPTVDNYIDAFIHVANLTGSMDNVGVGTDRWSKTTLANEFKRVDFERTTKGFFGLFDSDHKHVEGFNYYDEWESFIDRMIARGLSDSEIKKILGDNFIRVYKKVWK